MMNSNSTATDCITDAPHEPLRRGQRPLTPDEDPFYQPPKGYEQEQPGAVLRSREVELGFLGVIPQRITATQLLYRSTNLHGEPEVAVTTVLVPAERDPELMCPVLSYQCAIDAVVSGCFPSYALRRGAERRPVHRLIALGEGPCGVSAAVLEASLVTHQHLVRAKGMAVRAAGGWLGYPLPFDRSDQLTLHL